MGSTSAGTEMRISLCDYRTFGDLVRLELNFQFLVRDGNEETMMSYLGRGQLLIGIVCLPQALVFYFMGNGESLNVFKQEKMKSEVNYRKINSTEDA